MKKKVEVIVEYAGDNLSAYIKDAPIVVVGKNMREIGEKTREAVGLYLESCAELNVEPVQVLQGDLEFTFNVDTAAFINYYSNIFTKAALSRITGINERQIWHYAAGLHKPRRTQINKIETGIHELSSELSSIRVM